MSPAYISPYGMPCYIFFFTEFLFASTFRSWRADALSAKGGMSKPGNPMSLLTIVRVFVKTIDDFVFLTSSFALPSPCVTRVTLLC